MTPGINDNSQRPLSGQRILITRPLDQAGSVRDKIIALGGKPILLPTIATASFDDLTGWADFENNLAKIDWIIFTSENGVSYFVEQIRERKIDLRVLANSKIAAIGRGTTAVLGEFDLKPDFIPTRAVVEALVNEMPEKHDLSSTVILRVRGNLADGIIEESFSKIGAEVIVLTAYRTFHPTWSTEEKKRLVGNLPDALLFTSGSTVQGLIKNLDAHELKRLLTKAKVFSIGPKVSAMLKDKSFPIEAEAIEHNIEGLLEAVKNYFVSN